jgi:hypothetical protein
VLSLRERRHRGYWAVSKPLLRLVTDVRAITSSNGAKNLSFCCGVPIVMRPAVGVMRMYPLAKLARPCYERIGGSKLICSISGSDGNLNRGRKVS